jgi:hypothetical protein
LAIDPSPEQFCSIIELLYDARTRICPVSDEDKNAVLGLPQQGRVPDAVQRQRQRSGALLIRDRFTGSAF